VSVPARHRQTTSVIPPHERLSLPHPERVMGLTSPIQAGYTVQARPEGCVRAAPAGSRIPGFYTEPMPPEPRSAEYFDGWYADRVATPTVDEIMNRHMGFPPDTRAGVVPAEAIPQLLKQDSTLRHGRERGAD